MNKKYIKFIGISIIVSIFGLAIPFIGFGKTGFQTTSLPASLIIAMILLLMGATGLYNDTKNNDFYVAKVMAIIGICITAVCVIISPLFSSVTYFSPIDYIQTILEAASREDAVALFKYMMEMFKGYTALFVIVTIGGYFYAFSIFRISSGLLTFNLEQQHKRNLQKNLKQFAVTSCVNTALLALMLFVYTSIFTVLLPYFNSDYMPDQVAFKIIGLFLVLFIIILPLMIVVSIFYIIGLIKSIIYVFKTPKKLIETIDE